MTPSPGAAVTAADGGAMAMLARVLRERAKFYRGRGYNQVAAELEHEAAIVDALLRPDTRRPGAPGE
jgi:hypothetical protein